VYLWHTLKKLAQVNLHKKLARLKYFLAEVYFLLQDLVLCTELNADPLRFVTYKNCINEICRTKLVHVSWTSSFDFLQKFLERVSGVLDSSPLGFYGNEIINEVARFSVMHLSAVMENLTLSGVKRVFMIHVRSESLFFWHLHSESLLLRESGVSKSNDKTFWTEYLVTFMEQLHCSWWTLKRLTLSPPPIPPHHWSVKPRPH